MPDQRDAVTAVLAALTAVSGVGAALQNGRTRDACVSVLVWSAATLMAVLLWGERQ